MAKAPKSTFVCSECGGTSPKWVGKCPHCEMWNTMSETIIEESSSAGTNRFNSWTGTKSEVVPLKNIKTETTDRSSTGNSELDRVLGGGGLVKGSVVLIGGDPGIGKSTLLLQACDYMGRKSKKILYATGEESLYQVKARSDRLGFEDSPILLYGEIQLEKIKAAIANEKPDSVVIDSIQTVYSSELQAAPGTVSQVRECAAHLTRIAKSDQISMFIVGHVTKDGALAGPRVLEHMVDSVLYFEGDPSASFRTIRAIKNRFGPANELGLFNMTEKGLVELLNPSEMLITPHDRPVSGSIIFAALEGNRPFLVEVQALVEESVNPNAKRYASGVDTSKVQMLLAVLQKHAGITASDQNVYVKTTGGVKIAEPGIDLPILISMYSSLMKKPVSSEFAVFGEVGLAGELRPVHNADVRIKEAAKLGYSQIIVPKRSKYTKVPGVTVHEYSRVDEVLKSGLF